MVEGTCSNQIIEVIEHIPKKIRATVKKITLDMAGFMSKVVVKCFPNATKVIDRFHVQKLAYDAVQEICIAHRWNAINEETNAKENAKGIKMEIHENNC